MSEARNPSFVTRSHPNPHLERDDGGGVVFEREDPQAIVELRLPRPERRIIDLRIRERLPRAQQRDERDERDRGQNKPAAGTHGGVQYPQRLEVSSCDRLPVMQEQ
jgi:hypothetical protein